MLTRPVGEGKDVDKNLIIIIIMCAGCYWLPFTRQKRKKELGI